MLRFYKLGENATSPSKGSELAAGFDLYSAMSCVVPAHDKKCVYTDIQIELPDGCYGRIAPRSGLAINNFISIGAGVVDRDYRGNIGVIIFNLGNDDFHISVGDRIAQLICEKIYYPILEETKIPLNDTARGDSGFGSSG